MAVYEDHPENSWEEIDQADWDEIVLRVDDEGTWHLRFEYEDEFGDVHGYAEEEISWSEFLDIYDAAADLEQELEVEY